MGLPGCDMCDGLQVCGLLLGVYCFALAMEIGLKLTDGFDEAAIDGLLF